MNTFKPVQWRDPEEGSELLERLSMQPHRNQGEAAISQGPEIPEKKLEKECRLPGGLKNPAYKLGTTEKLRDLSGSTG